MFHPNLTLTFRHNTSSFLSTLFFVYISLGNWLPIISLHAKNITLRLP